MSALTVLAPGVMRLEGCKVVEYAPPVSGKALGGRVWCKGRAASASSRALVFRPPKRRPHRHLRRPSAPVPYLPEIEIDGGGSGAIEGRGARGARGGRGQPFSCFSGWRARAATPRFGPTAGDPLLRAAHTLSQLKFEISTHPERSLINPPARVPPSRASCRAAAAAAAAAPPPRRRPPTTTLTRAATRTAATRCVYFFLVVSACEKKSAALLSLSPPRALLSHHQPPAQKKNKTKNKKR